MSLIGPRSVLEGLGVFVCLPTFKNLKHFTSKSDSPFSLKNAGMGLSGLQFPREGKSQPPPG